MPRLGSKDDKNEWPFRKQLVWVECEQQQYNRPRRNQTSSLTPDRVRLLESIGLSCTSKPVTDDAKWLKRYYFELGNLQHQYNVIDVPVYYSEHRELVQWMKDQKHDYGST